MQLPSVHNGSITKVLINLLKMTNFDTGCTSHNYWKIISTRPPSRRAPTPASRTRRAAPLFLLRQGLLSTARRSERETLRLSVYACFWRVAQTRSARMSEERHPVTTLRNVQMHLQFLMSLLLVFASCC